MDLTNRFGTITLSRTIEVFAPIFVLAHNWNIDDNHEKVLACKKQYIEDALLQEFKCNRISGKVVRNPVTDDYDELVEYQLDYKATSFDIKAATNFLFSLLRKNGNPILHQLVNGDDLSCGISKKENVAEEDDIDSDICSMVDDMPLHILKKKVTELTNEKDKWDKSIAIAAKIGLLFYEKELTKPATEAAFIDEYEKWFTGIPKKTISMIYKSLPDGYRNTGSRPVTKVDCIDDDMVDTIMEASVAAGFITQKDGAKDSKELKERLEADEYEVPSDSYIKRIAGTCKRVALKNR